VWITSKLAGIFVSRFTDLLEKTAIITGEVGLCGMMMGRIWSGIVQLYEC
jgi:hypothetical protein